jgi:hypothetical protein
MTYGYDVDDALLIVGGVDHAVGANAGALAITAAG